MTANGHLPEPITRRDAYRTTSSQGLNFESVPMRLFSKATRLAWDPMAISFEQDQVDWGNLAGFQKDSLLTTTAQFVAGEEAVTLDLLPLVLHVARSGMVEEEIYLTSFLHEEAKHTQFFRRWLNDVAGSTEDLHDHMGENYRQIFLEELPAAMNRLLVDGSRETLARALVTYNLVVEGVLAETGYHYFTRMNEVQGVMPGLLEGVRLIARDESRHLRFAVYMLQRLISEDNSMWAVVKSRMDELTPLALGVQADGRRRFIATATAELGEIPPELQALIDDISSDVERFAQGQVEKRLRVVERARTQTREEIDEEELEEA